MVLIFSSSSLKDRLIDQTINQIGINNNDLNFNIFSPEHDKIISTSIEMFIDKPIFGHGPKSFREVCDTKKYSKLNGCSTHPHNTYFQLLSETGLVGFIFITIFFFFVTLQIINLYILRFYKKNQYNFIELNIYIALFLSLFPFVPTGNFFNNWISIIYFIPIAFLYKKFQFNK